MKRFMKLLIVLCSLSCSSVLADLHITYDPTDLLIPNGAVSGSLSDGWMSGTSYGSGGQYMGDSPVSGSLEYDSPHDTVGPLYAASEVGISEEGIFYAKAYGESSENTDPFWQYPVSTTARADGCAWFTIDSEPLSLHWTAWGFEGYDETGWTPALYQTGWSIALHKLTFTAEGTFQDLVYTTNSGQETWPEGTELLYLDPESTYQLTWSLAIMCSDFDYQEWEWAQLNIDLANPVPVPGAAMLSILGLGTVGIKLIRKTKK